MSKIAEKAIDCFNRKRELFLDDLKTLIRIPSVSFAGFDQRQVERCARAVAVLAEKSGLENVKLLETDGSNPAVYGEWTKAPGMPTVCLYAHYDVQPPGNEALWSTLPFEPDIRDGRLFGRGAADDKAGISAHLAVVSSYLHGAGALPVNVKVLFEGEEETGSAGLSRIIACHRKMLDADILVILDTVNMDTGHPALTVALRGLVTVQVEVRALKHSVHSGLWGGPLPDPAMALSKMLASLVDNHGRLAVKGLTDMVRPLTRKGRASVRSLPFDDSEYRAQSGIADGAALVGGGRPPV